MNILVCLSQKELTGAEVYAITWADEIIKRGHKVVIVSDKLHKPTKAIYEKVELADRSLKSRLKNIKELGRLIKKHQIDVICANSRASAWVGNWAGKIYKKPLVVFAHGRQATSLSRKIVKGFGDLTVGVCETINEQIIKEFNINRDRLKIVRNGFPPAKVKQIERNERKTILFVSRLSGPKGEMIYNLLKYFRNRMNELGNVEIKIAGGLVIDSSFRELENDFNFLGFVKNLEDEYSKADVVIGSGRSAIEGIFYNKPTVVIGEACTVGLVTEQSMKRAIETNFGDMDEIEKQFDFEKVFNDTMTALKLEECDKQAADFIQKEYSLETQVERIEHYLKSVIVRYHRKMIPVLCYHRVIKEVPEGIKNGIYVTEKLFDEHLNYLHKNGYQTITINELIDNNINTEKKVIITFDDGYEDNYTTAFPLLKKYNFSALIFLVSGLTSNQWDAATGEVLAEMMNDEQIKEMHNYGIEFGAHTVTHSNLIKTDLETAQREIKNSRSDLENRLGFEIKYFAYPYGNYNNEIKKITREAGFEAAYATDNAPLASHEDIFAIRRIGIFPNTNLAGFKRKINPAYLFRKVSKDLINKIPDIN